MNLQLVNIQWYSNCIFLQHLLPDYSSVNISATNSSQTASRTSTYLFSDQSRSRTELQHMPADLNMFYKIIINLATLIMVLKITHVWIVSNKQQHQDLYLYTFLIMKWDMIMKRKPNLNIKIKIWSFQ